MPTRRPPLRARLAPLPRMVTTLVGTLVAVLLVSTAFARGAVDALPRSVPAPQIAVEAAAAATFLVLSLLWWWLDPVLVRAGLGAWSRFLVVGIGCFVSAYTVTAFPAVALGVWPKPIAASTDDALTVLAASLVLPVAAWVPGFWSGELVGWLWRERDRARDVSDGRRGR